MQKTEERNHSMDPRVPIGMGVAVKDRQRPEFLGDSIKGMADVIVRLEELSSKIRGGSEVATVGACSDDEYTLSRLLATGASDLESKKSDMLNAIQEIEDILF